MGLKGINPLEAHCEKIVVGLAGAALVGIVVWQFAGPKPKVRIGKDEYVLTDAYDVLERRAAVVRGQIEGPGSPESLPAEDMPLGLLADAGDFSATTVAPAKSLAIAFGTAGIPVEGGIVAPGDNQGTRFAEVTPPAPTGPVAEQIAATIHPMELQLNEGLTPLVAEPDRPDMVAVTVEARFPAAKFAAALASDPDGPGGPIEPLPAVWVNIQDMTIIDVELLRQKLQPDGSWGQEESVAAMPGRVELRAEMADSSPEMMTADQMRQWASQAIQLADEIRRPPFYSIVYGDDWVPPTEVNPMAGAAVDNPEQSRLMAELDRCRGQIDAVEKKLADLGGGGRGPGAGPRGTGHAGQPGGPREEANDRQRQNLERQLEALHKREQQIIDQLISIGVENIPGVEQSTPMAAQPLESEAEQDPPLLEADEIRIWAHDVHVERGATYRYRLRVWVTNPFFGHDVGLVEEQKPLAASPLLASEASEWTDNVHVHDEAYYFITSAQEGGLVGGAGASAVASVYVFRWGYWREGSARMEPGDALATTVQSPMLGDLLAAAAAPEDIRNDPMDGGHRTAEPGGREVQPESAPAEKVEYEPVKVARDVVLLDVGPSVNADGDEVAYLREETGAIVDRDPEAESQREIFKLLRGSAQRGEEALKPKEMATPTSPRPEPPRPGDDHGRRPTPPDVSPTSPSGPGGG